MLADKLGVITPLYPRKNMCKLLIGKMLVNVHALDNWAKYPTK